MFYFIENMDWGFVIGIFTEWTYTKWTRKVHPVHPVPGHQWLARVWKTPPVQLVTTMFFIHLNKKYWYYRWQPTHSYKSMCFYCYFRTQNYLFDLIHLHFCYKNTIQYNTVQFMGFLYSFWSGRLPLRSDKTTVTGSHLLGGFKTMKNKNKIKINEVKLHVQVYIWP